MHLAIFDFDGTITTRDSFKDFILYTHGTFRTFLATIILSPVLLLFALKILSNSRTKELIITFFYRGWRKTKLQEAAKGYARERLPHIVKKSALAQIAWHKREGHRIVVVSASPEFYLEHWCREEGVELLATRIVYRDHRVTGKIDGKNCHGEEKIHRLTERYKLKEFDYIYAYGDSDGDRPLARIANEFHYQKFN